MSADDAPVLRAVDEPAPSGLGVTTEPGIESLHAILSHVAIDNGIESLTVVIDDADLGRQAFRSGDGPHPPIDLEPGVHLSGGAQDAVDALALHALCAASVRAAVLDGVVSGTASPELELRRISGVSFVDIIDGDEPVVEVVVTPDAGGDVAHTTVETARRALGSTVAIVVDRLAVEPTAPPSTAGSAEGSEPTEGSEPSDETGDLELLMVHTTPETREIEVHIRRGDARSIGRAPMAGGLAAAVEATLSALQDLGISTHLDVGWARTVETTVDPSFVVTVALHDTDADTLSYGAASGASPIEAAARSTLLAAHRAT